MGNLTNADRLGRIEDKIDQMSEAIIALARVQEKVSDLENRRQESHERMNQHSKKLDDIDTKVTRLMEKVNNIQIVGLAAGGLITTIILALLTGQIVIGQ